MRLNVDINDSTYFKLKQKVGDRKISETLRNLVDSFVENEATGNGKQQQRLMEINDEVEVLLNQINSKEQEKSAILFSIKQQEDDVKKEEKKMTKMEYDTLKTHMGDMI